MPFDIIAFDADDTLWHNEIYYRRSQELLFDLLGRYGIPRDAAENILHRVDVGNLPDFGYGIKGFTLSMIETAIEATGGQISAADIQSLVEQGRAMVRSQIEPLEHSASVIAQLAERYALMLITKGDLRDQERKLAGSGLAGSFRYVEIVSDKTPDVYAALMRRHRLVPEHFLMVGNSMRSDILPVLALGGWAVYVPFTLTWAHEAGSAPTDSDGRYHEIEHLGQLPALIQRIE
jgi:putative hydrolase of the HAD superfamily